MKSFKHYTIIFVFFLIWFTQAKAQNDYNSVLVTDTIAINFQNHYTISQVHILPNTESIYLKGKKLYSEDYTFKYSEGNFSLSSSLPYSIFDTLIVTYRSLKLNLKKEYKRRSLVIKYDEKFGDTISVPVSYTHLRAHETVLDLVCRLLLEKKKHLLQQNAISYDHYRRQTCHNYAKQLIVVEQHRTT